MLCEKCKVKQTSSEYELDDKKIPLCFFCLRTYLEEGKNPIRVKGDKEEEEKRKELELKEKTDFFRKIDPQAKYWIQRYLGLSGVMRNSYNQLVDKCKRLSMMQISHILKEVHNYDVSPEMVGKFKRFLIKEGLLKTDKEFEEDRPSEKQLKEIRQEGARSQAIERSKEKSHLEPEELEDMLEHRKKGKEELTQKDRIKELREKQERGLCLTCEEEEELEEYEEAQEDSFV